MRSLFERTKKGSAPVIPNWPRVLTLQRVSRLTAALGIGRVDEMPALVAVLALGGLVLTFGASFVWPVTTIYIHFALGQPLTVAGLVLMLSSGSSLAGQLAGGLAFDRWGGRRVLLVGLSTITVMLTVIALVRVWPVYVVAMTLNGFAYGLVEPAVNALISRSWPEGGRRGFNFVYVARNAGVALGTAFGGFVASYSFAAAFLANAAAALAYAAMVWRRVPARVEPSPGVPGRGTTREPEAAPGASDATAPQGPVGPDARWALTAMGLLVAGVALVWMAYSQWQAVISVYMQTLGYSLASYSLLWTINGVLIVVGQPLVSWVTRRWVRGSTAQMVTGAALFALAFGLVWRYPRYPGFVLGMVVLTLGEMLSFPAFPASAAQMALPGRMGLFQGLVGGAVSAGRMLGPLGGGALYDRISPPGVLAAAAVTCMVAAACFAVHRLAARRALSHAGERPFGRPRDDEQPVTPTGSSARTTPR